MPEFEQRKHKSLTEQQLYDEYHNIPKEKPVKSNKKKKKKGKKSNKAVKREAMPVSNERKIRQAEADRRLQQEKKEVSTARRKAEKAAKEKASEKRTAGKSRKKGNYTLYYILIAIVILAVLSVLSTTVLFNITKFEVVGNTEYSDEDIIAACGINKGENLLRINTRRAEEAIPQKLVYIEKAELHRGFPNRLTIKVEPAKKTACFAYTGGNYYIVSAKGRLLEAAKSQPDNCVLIIGYRPNLSDKAEVGLQLAEDSEKRIALALQLIKEMENIGYDRSVKIDLTDILNITITYDDRISIVLGTSASSDMKLERAFDVIRRDVTENEKCEILITNPDRAFKRTVHEGAGEDYVVTTPAVTTAPEETTAVEG